MARKHLIELVVLLICCGWLVAPVQAQEEQADQVDQIEIDPETVVCAQDVIVQVDDWLSKLSDKFYGDVLAFPAIAEATNAIATIDNTYTTIENVDLIEPGWKLCIVDAPAAEQILGFELENAPALDDTPDNLTGVITIGAAHALSGPVADHAQAIEAGINLAVRDVNQSGLLGDAQLQIRWEDTGGNPDRAKAAFETLANDGEVIAILGPTLSQSAFAANPVAQAAGVPVIGSSNVAENLTGIGDFIFRTSLPESAIIAYTVTEATAALDLQSVILVYDEENAFTRNNLAVFEQVLAEQGVEILAAVPYATGTPDFSDQLSQLQGSSADAIVLLALAEDAANIIAQARESGIPESVRFIGAGSFDAPTFLEVGGNAANGTLVGVAWNANNSSGSNRQFVTNFVDEYGRPPGHY